MLVSRWRIIFICLVLQICRFCSPHQVCSVSGPCVSGYSYYEACTVPCSLIGTPGCFCLHLPIVFFNYHHITVKLIHRRVPLHLTPELCCCVQPAAALTQHFPRAGEEMKTSGALSRCKALGFNLSVPLSGISHRQTVK